MSICLVYYYSLGGYKIIEGIDILGENGDTRGMIVKGKSGCIVES